MLGVRICEFWQNHMKIPQEFLPLPFAAESKAWLLGEIMPSRTTVALHTQWMACTGKAQLDRQLDTAPP
jgi:hypothetical protein